MNSSAVNARIRATVEEIRRPGGDVRDGARQGDPVEPLEPPDVERAGGVDGHRVDVAHAVHRLHQERPERAERGQEDLALQRACRASGRAAGSAPPTGSAAGTRPAPGTPARRDRSSPSRIPIGMASTVATPSPSAQPRTVLANASQNARVLHEVPERAHRGAHRRQVALVDQPGAGDELPDEQGRGDRRHEHDTLEEAALVDARIVAHPRRGCQSPGTVGIGARRSSAQTSSS